MDYSEVPNQSQDKLRLHPEEMDRVAVGAEPYFDMLVTMPGTSTEVLVYVDTTEEDFMYDPQTYVSDYKSNLSTVIKITLDSPNVYTISNIVLPDNVLMPTTNVPSTPDTVYKANFVLDSTVKFTRLYDSVSKKYAFYTLIENDPAKRAYLLPVVDTTQTGPRSKTVRAVLTVDQTATGKYVFELTESDYPQVNVSKPPGGSRCHIL